jgi:hypothetical protein
MTGLGGEVDARRSVNAMNNEAASGDSGNSQRSQRYWATNPGPRPDRI